jgi:hypothetical protein
MELIEALFYLKNKKDNNNRNKANANKPINKYLG